MHRLVRIGSLSRLFFHAGCVVLMASGLYGQGAPSAVSVTPSIGAGVEQRFSFVFSGGTGTLVSVQIDISSQLAAGNACYLFYYLGSSTLFLADNAGQWQPGKVLGASGGQLGNSQCSVDTRNATASLSGATLTLELPMRFERGYAGPKNLWMLAENAAQNSGWVSRGSWAVPGQPSAVSVSPSTGAGLGPQTFTFVFSDTGGAVNVGSVQIDISSLLAGANACYLFFYPGSRALYLASDVGQWQPSPVVVAGGGAPGAGMLENSQCKVDAAASSVSLSGNDVVLSLALSFKAAYAGEKNIWMLGESVAAGVNTGWVNRGTWVVPPETISTPTASGPVNGVQGTSYPYSAAGAVSNYGHPSQYRFNWGDGTNSGWLATGTTSASHSWAPGTYNVTVQARCRGDASVVSASSPALVVSIPQPDFALPTPQSLTVEQRSSKTTTETVTSSHGFASLITFTYANWPVGLSASFSPGQLTPTGAVAITVAAGPESLPGTYDLPFTATGGGITHTTAIAVTVAAQPCQLLVNQPSGMPSAARTGGNLVSGTGSLQLSAPASGSWLVYLRAHLNFRALGSNTWSEVTYNETMTSISNGASAGTSYSSGLVQASLEPRGNGEYQITLTSHGVCGGQDFNLMPSNPSPSAIVTVSRPTIAADGGVQGIWWFNEVGKDDANNGYFSSASITGNSNSIWTLTYTITQGATKARLTCSNCSNTVVQALAPSGGCTQDVSIQANVGGFYATAPVKLMVNRPAGRYSQPTYYNSPAVGGYWSKDYFTFTDLCTMSMPSIAYHETFTGQFHDLWPGGAGAYWTTPPVPGGWSGYRADQYTTYDDIIGSCSDQDCRPPTVPPTGYTFTRNNIGSLMQQAIVEIHQMWWVGDSTAGSWQGFLANQCKQTLYQDHGEDINYW